MQEQIDSLKTRVARLEETVAESKMTQNIYVAKHDKMDETLTELKVVTGVMKNDIHYMRGGVDDLRKTVTWIARLIIGAVVLAIIAYVFRNGGPP